MVEYIGVKKIKATPMTKGDASVKTGYKNDTCNLGESTNGYLVEYEGGYQSWSPKDVFDKAYRPCSAMTFGLAIEALTLGKKVARSGWNGKGIFIELQKPDENSKMSHPYIFIDTTGLQTDNPDAPKSRVPWLASQTDMLSEDWTILK